MGVLDHKYLSFDCDSKGCQELCLKRKIAEFFNYTADDEVYPQMITFGNGRTVRLSKRIDWVEGYYLTVGTGASLSYCPTCGRGLYTKFKTATCLDPWHG